MVFIYGYSLLYILSGIFAYGLNAFHVFGIALVCYAFDKLVFKSVKRFFTIFATLIVLVGIGIYLLYRWEMLEPLLLVLGDFFKVYYLSVMVSTVAIEPFHQVVALILIGIPLLAILERFIKFNRDYYLYLIAVTVILVVVGYLTKSMGGERDREAFLILSATLIAYYFYNYYYEFSDFRRKFGPFITTIVLFVLVIVVGGRFLYYVDPRPLTVEKKKVAFELSEDVDLERPELNKYNYFKRENASIAESFDYKNVELFRIRAQGVRYLKADTFELYYDGVWSRSRDLPYIDNDGDSVEKSKAYDQVDYEEYYKIEDTRIIMSNLNTNVLLMNNYGSSDTRFYDNIRVMHDTRRGIFFSNDLLPERYVYEFDAILPEYGSPVFDNLVRLNSNDAYPDELNQLSGPNTDRYESVANLAREITEGIDNKYDQALAIEKYLHENYSYSEAPPSPPENVDPIIYFLFESEEGFCQQFTTAYILMARSLDIPSRYAVGFYVGQRDVEPESYQEALEMGFIEDGVYSVYDSNAHTWPEAYFPEVGWIMFEPTPGRYYKQEVVDYDPYDFENNLGEAEGRFSFEFDIIYLYIFIAIVSALVMMAMVIITFRMRANLKKRSNKEKLLAIHMLMRRYLRVSGLPKEASETPREFARNVDEYMFDIKGKYMVDLMNDYESVVYGGGHVDEEILAVHHEYLNLLRQRMLRRMNKFNYTRVKVTEFFTINV